MAISIVAGFIGNTLCILAIVTPINALALRFALWIYNQIAYVHDAAQHEKLKSAPPLKTTDAGPYTAPGSEASPDSQHEHTGIPVPEFGHFMLVALCAAVAKVVIVGAVIALELNLLDTPFPTYTLTAVPVIFFVVSGIYALMLRTTFPRAMLVAFLALLPIVALGIAIFVTCFSMLPKHFH